MTQTVESLFDTGLERYKAGEPAADLIPVFKEVCDRSPKASAAWICLAWLYLLENKPNLALKAAQKAVKLNPQDPQARVNLAIAMLETKEKGVRQHIDIAQQLITINPEWQEEVQNSIADGFSRKPDWQSLAKVKGWLFGE
ncbi:MULTISPECIES: tetratricopeptide repeat protein [unclassified Anabaena]|uniref:tetratricopeptide repeat protein n=1 Tax=unclassified Anabaena TaxID=2619674 RepID=UPI00082A050A|nr:MULTISPECIES: tetratricopeptide repeat protein [unclassified Anabaena]